MRIIGVDPGFSSIGLACVEYHKGGRDLELLQVFRTKPSPKKHGLLVSDDNLRRVREISGWLRPHIASADVVCCETFSPPRNASAGAKVAFVWGALVSLCEARGVALLQATPQAIKKALTGRRDASKEQIQAAVDLLYGEAAVVDALGTIPRGEFEHPYDALAAIHTCLDSEQVRLLLAFGTPSTTDDREERHEHVHPTLGFRLRSQATQPRKQVRQPSRTPRDD